MWRAVRAMMQHTFALRRLEMTKHDAYYDDVITSIYG